MLNTARSPLQVIAFAVLYWDLDIIETGSLTCDVIGSHHIGVHMVNELSIFIVIVVEVLIVHVE